MLKLIYLAMKLASAAKLNACFFYMYKLDFYVERVTPPTRTQLSQWDEASVQSSEPLVQTKGANKLCRINPHLLRRAESEARTARCLPHRLR